MTVHNSLNIEICDSPRDAIARGYAYAAKGNVKPITVKKVIVVRRGTMAGNSTVDFLLETEDGQEYVFMVTSNQLKTIPAFQDERTLE